MSSLPTILNQMSPGWSAVMWTVAWQGTILAIAVEVLCLTLRRSSPNLRLWLWQILAIKLLVTAFWLPAIELPDWSSAASPQFAAADPPIGTGVAFDQDLAFPLGDVSIVDSPSVSFSPPPEVDANVTQSTAALTPTSWLFLAYALIVAALVGRLLWQPVRLRRLLRGSVVTSDSAILQLIADSSAAIGLRRSPQVLLSSGARSPFVCGIWNSILVLPADLTESLAPRQLRQAVLHELAHLRRHDLLWGWLPELVRIAYWFHPASYWISYRARLEREMACDQLAMLHSDRCAASYAEMLVQVVSRASQPERLKA